MRGSRLRKKATGVTKTEQLTAEGVFHMSDIDGDGLLAGQDLLIAVRAAGVPVSKEQVEKAR